MKSAARVLFWLGLAVIAVATLGPIEWRPETGLPAQVERCGAFLVISFLLTLGYPRHRSIGWLALLAAAAILEILQNAVPGRHGRVIDFEAKAFGVLVGLLLGLAADRVGRLFTKPL